MGKFKVGDRVSVMGTVEGYSSDLVRVQVDGGLVYHLKPDRLTLVERKLREPDAPAVVKYGDNRTYIRTVLGWILVQNGLVVGNQLRTFGEMLEWENLSFRPAIEAYWTRVSCALNHEEPGHGEPF